jgi:hypothetical protein
MEEIMKLFSIRLLKLTVLSMLLISPVYAQPTGESLIQAWEKIQKSDPKVLNLEKLGDNHYKFKTDHFPFDGELRIKGVIMDDVGTKHDTEFIFGTIQTELIGLPVNILHQYSYNYSTWSRNNTLYYDKKDGNWISSKQFQDAMTNRPAKRYQSNWGISDLAIIALAVVGIIIILRIFQKNKAYMKTALKKQDEGLVKYDLAVQQSEKTLQQGEETNKLLKDILEVLKSKN